MGGTSLSVHPATHPLGTHSCPALHPGGGDSQVRWQRLSLLLPGAPVPYKRHDVGEEESPVELECQGIPPPCQETAWHCQASLGTQRRVSAGRDGPGGGRGREGMLAKQPLSPWHTGGPRGAAWE